jgi:hypothetical protein
MSRNEESKLALEIIKIGQKLTNLKKKFLEEKDPNKKEKLREQGIKNREKILTKHAKIKELTAFNTPASTPVKSKKNNGNNNVQPIKKKSRKK